MEDEKAILLEDRVNEAFFGDDGTLPLAQALFRMSMEKKVSRHWNARRRVAFIGAQMEFVKVLLRIIMSNRKDISPAQHFQNLIFFSDFISDWRLRRRTRYAVRNVRFECVAIAKIDPAKLQETDAFLLRDSPREFFVPTMLVWPSNKGILDEVLGFLGDTPYAIDPEWYEFYKRRLFRHEVLASRNSPR
jgi:hypothetical protein